MTRSRDVAAGAGLVAVGVAAAVRFGVQAQAREGSLPDDLVQQATKESEFGFTFGPPRIRHPWSALSRSSGWRPDPSGRPAGWRARSKLVYGHVVWEPGKIDADAWIVSFIGSCTPVFGPTGIDKATRQAARERPQWALGTTSRVIDAESGDVLFTYSLSDVPGEADSEPCTDDGQFLPVRSEAVASLDEASIRILDPQGVVVRPIGDEAAVAIDQGGTIEVARRSFGFAGMAAGPGAVSLATVTVTDYGHERSDTAMESDLDLIIEDRQAWVVLFHDVRVPIFGPRIEGASSGPEFYSADVVIVVDATTGKFLRAENL